jgi:site-specific DNA-methyltransferase (adenine-specific)
VTAVLYRGDALAVLRDLPDASVDGVITDPPYSSGGMFRGDRTMDPTQKYVPTKEVINFHPTFTGDNRDQRSYGYWSTLWLGECLRVTKLGGTVLLFTDWRQLPTTTDALQAGGWVWRGVVVWDKTAGIRPSAGRFRQQAEFVIWGSNGPMPVDYTESCLNGVFTHAPFRGKEHIAGKPLGLMRDLVEIVPLGGTILDPFMGSGTTGVAAVLKGRSFIGVELADHHYRVAEDRIRSTERGYRPPPLQMVLGAEIA